jgi:hypothetical protein
MRRIAPTQGAMSGNAAHACIDLGKSELKARADAIWSAISRSHSSIVGQSAPGLRGDLTRLIAEYLNSEAVVVAAMASDRWRGNGRVFGLVRDTIGVERRNELINQLNLEADFYVDKLQKAPATVPAQIASVVSDGQSGGITAHTVNIANHAVPLAAQLPPPRPWWKSWWTFAVGLAGIVAAVFAGLDHYEKRGPMADNKQVNVTSHNQSGGITAGTVNIYGKQPRHMSQENADFLRQHVPTTKKVTVTAIMGDSEAMEFAQEVTTWLRANGWTNVDGVNQAVFSGPVFGQNINPNKDGFDIQIGTNR